jgi:hypothetical protein
MRGLLWAGLEVWGGVRKRRALKSKAELGSKHRCCMRDLQSGEEDGFDFTGGGWLRKTKQDQAGLSRRLFLVRLRWVGMGSDGDAG